VKSKIKINSQVLERILDMVDDAIVVTHLTGEIAFCNRPCEKFTGHRLEDLLGHSLEIIFQNNTGSKIVAKLEKMFKKNFIHCFVKQWEKVIFKHENSSCFPGKVFFAPIDIENKRFLVLFLKRKTNHQFSRINMKKQDLGIKAMNLAIEYWCFATNTSKVALAEHSKLWKVYRSPNGFERTQTLDKYLSDGQFPKKPRWGHIFKTLNFVLSHCNVPSRLRTELERYSVELKMMK